jgi:2-oxoglutarate ferredoxin oxidoreductase subunit delta
MIPKRSRGNNYHQNGGEQGMAIVKQKKRLSIKIEWCKGCGICVAFCPEAVLKLEKGKVAVAIEERCIACGMCETRCPDYAIYLQEERADGQ